MKQDCYDGLDEENCTKPEIEAAASRVDYLMVHKAGSNATFIDIYWRLYIMKGYVFEFMPSISELSGPKANIWVNNTQWISISMHRFTNLKPYTEYNMTVYVRVAGSDLKDGYPPTQYVAARTGEAGNILFTTI